MKFSLSWLKTHLETEASLEDLVEAMTMAGLEVEAVENPAETLKDFTTANVVSAEKHPNADKLRVCEVDTQDGRKTIVCGAPNARAGMTAIYAGLGTHIPGAGFSLDKKPRKIRGVESHGMMCSAKELDLGEDHDGILDLDGTFEVGTSVAEALGLNDPIIDFEVTPNRPDWLGIYGIARDLAATGIGRLKTTDQAAMKGEFTCPIEIRTDDEKACPTFLGRVIKGVSNGPSPDWLQARLKSVGLRPINILVDITNFFSLDRDRPLHVYDMAKLNGAVHARLGRKGESFLALDGKTYDVDESMCVIADDSGVLGLGGIMGGETTGCDDGTIDVLIECADFDPLRTARTGRALGISSDAQYRFARGIDSGAMHDNMERATAMVMDLCGGTPSEVYQAGTLKAPPEAISYQPALTKKMTGLEVGEERQIDILEQLGFAVERQNDDWVVSVPTWRRDCAHDVDIVEEVARIEGLENLPEESLPVHVGKREIVTPLQKQIRAGRRVMAVRGFNEAITWSFMSEGDARLFTNRNYALRLANPIASDLDTMRPSILCNLAKAAQKNVDHGAEEVRLFEVGGVYLGDTPNEQLDVIAGLVKPKSQRHWQGDCESYDAFNAKADLIALLEAIGHPASKFQVFEAEGSHWHPGRSGSLRLGPKNIIASFGELHPATLRELDIEGRVFGFELTLNALPKSKAKPTKTKAVFNPTEFTPIRRDFAFLVDEALPAQELLNAAKGSDKANITHIHVFDDYRGKGMEEGQKSIAIEVTFEPREQVNDKDIQAFSDRLVAAVSKATGAVLR